MRYWGVDNYNSPTEISAGYIQQMTWHILLYTSVNYENIRKN
jgi:hypothetical protein